MPNAAFRARHPRGISTLTADAIFGATGAPWPVGEKIPTTTMKADYSASGVYDPAFHSDYPGSVLEIPPAGPGSATAHGGPVAAGFFPDLGLTETMWQLTLPWILLGAIGAYLVFKLK